MREIERVLKPEGLLVILNFNPWSFWVRYQFLWDKKMADSWGGHFISRSRVLDWLKLLNFEVIVSSEFNLDSISSKQGKFIRYGHSFFFTAYAVKAIKRRYNLIPLIPVKNAKPQLALINSLNSLAQKKRHE
jgi:ubiquinone/menaquinone biosynthesis C-methylase UbiE